MPRFCAVYRCANNRKKNPDKQFFGFPGIRDKRGRDVPEGIERRELWVRAIRRADLTPDKIRCASVCSDHFITGKPAMPGHTKDPDYIPSQNLGYVSGQRLSVESTPRYKRARKQLLQSDEHDMDIPMPSICAVPGCSSRSNCELDKRFYSFPSISDNRGGLITEGYQRRKLWLQALNRHDLNIANIERHLNVCSDHFVSGRPSEMGDMNNVDYVPSLNLECDVSKKSTGFIRVVTAASLSEVKFDEFKSNNFSSQINLDDENDFCPNAFRFECTFSISGDVSTQAFIPKVDIFERKPPETATVSEPEFFDCSPIPVNNAIIVKEIQNPIVVKMIPACKPILLRTKTLSEDLAITNELEKETRKLQQLETIKHKIIDEIRASKEEIEMEDPMETINIEIKTEEIRIKEEVVEDVEEIFPN